MGIFTTTNHSNVNAVDYDQIIPAAEGYNCTTGAAFAMMESARNDMNLFRAIITSDFNEVAAMNEGTSFGVINEGPKEIINKIVEMFKKLFAKIKGIFEAFIAKLRTLGGKNKTLLNDYKKKITNFPGWKGFKCKVRKPKNVDGGLEYTMRGTWGVLEDMYGLDWDKLEKTDGYDSDDIKDHIIKSNLPNGLKNSVDSDLKNMESEMMDLCFDDEEVVDDWSLGDILSDDYGGCLENADKAIRVINKYADKLKKCIGKVITELERVRSDASKVYLDKNTKTFKSQNVNVNRDELSVSRQDADTFDKTEKGQKENNQIELYSKRVSALQRIASAEQEVITSYTAALLAITKFQVAQARKVWTSAAAYASTHKEGYDYDLCEAIGESYAYDTMTDFESK